MCPWSPGEVLMETLVLLSILGTSSSRINQSVDCTSNDAEDHCYEAWRVAEGRVYQFGCTGHWSLLILTTGKCVLVSKFLN